MAMDLPYGEGGGQGAPDWFDENDPEPNYFTPNSVPPDGNYGHPTYNRIAALFLKHHGKPATYAQAQAWGTNVDESYFYAIDRNIREMPEAKAYAAQQAAGGAGGQQPAGGSSGGGAAGFGGIEGDWTDPSLDMIKAYGRSRGYEMNDDEAGWWKQQWPNLMRESPGDPSYATMRLSLADQWTSPDKRYGGGGGIGTGTDLLKPFGKNYEPPAFEAPPDFEAPDPNKLFEDKNFQFRMKNGIDALQKGASAKGTLLTGGTLKDISSWVSDFSSSEYDKIYDRAMTEDQVKYGRKAGEYDIARENLATKYGIERENWWADQDRPYSKLMGLAGLGLNGLNSQQNANAGYASGWANTVTGGAARANENAAAGANAGAAGRVGAANAWN